MSISALSRLRTRRASANRRLALVASAHKGRGGGRRRVDARYHILGAGSLRHRPPSVRALLPGRMAQRGGRGAQIPETERFRGAQQGFLDDRVIGLRGQFEAFQGLSFEIGDQRTAPQGVGGSRIVSPLSAAEASSLTMALVCRQTCRLYRHLRGGS